MPRMGKMQIAELKKFQAHLNAIRNADINAFVEACAKELAARLLEKVIKRTPEGDYSQSSGKKDGTLKRGWTSKNSDGTGSSSAKAYVDSLEINHVGNILQIEIVNPVEYASYVEYGHRKGNKGWTEGKFMLTISEQEIRNIAPRLLEANITKFLKGAMK